MTPIASPACGIAGFFTAMVRAAPQSIERRAEFRLKFGEIRRRFRFLPVPFAPRFKRPEVVVDDRAGRGEKQHRGDCDHPSAPEELHSLRALRKVSLD